MSRIEKTALNVNAEDFLKLISRSKANSMFSNQGFIEKREHKNRRMHSLLTEITQLT
jgi:uncharacterized protein (DUF2164 family)